MNVGLIEAFLLEPGNFQISDEALSPPLQVSFPGPSYPYPYTHASNPDSSVAVGFNNVVTTVNSSIQWYSRDGVLQHDQWMGSFFNDNANGGDARVVYDAVNNRFIVEYCAEGNWIDLAISKNGNPNDGWYFYKINTSLTINGQSTLSDFPGLATDGKVIYLTANMLTSDHVFEETHLWIIQVEVDPDRETAGAVF